MSREDTHKLIDKLFDMGYCGGCLFNFFKGGITNVEVKQTFKTSAQLVVMAVG